MVKSAAGLISEIRSKVNSLLHDEVIQQTIVVMRDLSSALNQLDGLIKGEDGSLTDKQKDDLKNILSPCERIHPGGAAQGELPITNRIIRTKNRILKAIGAPIPGRT